MAGKTPAEEFMAYAQLGQGIVAMVKASGLGAAKRGRKPAKAASAAKAKPGPKPGKKAKAAEAAAPTDGTQAPISNE